VKTRLVALLSAGLVAVPTASHAADRAAVYPFEGTGIDGKPIALKGHLGKVVVVAFWATWCVPCKKQLPVLDALRTKHDGKLEVIAISLDDTSTRSRVRGTVKRYRWKMPVMVDTNGDIGSNLNPRGLAPYALFVDHDGLLAYAQEGFAKGDDEKFGKRIGELVAALPATTEKPATAAKPKP
jgi:thiol-disulfide isomerase/thioredoxin